MHLHQRGNHVSGALNLKNTPTGMLASLAFYAATGIILLVLLPLSNYPPHLALTGIVSLITAYTLYMKWPWAKWLIAALFFVVTTMALYTVFFVIFTNVLVSIAMLAYAVLTWYFTYYAFIKKI
jgi:hypothetical protein